MFVIPDMSLLNTFRNEFDRNVVSKSFFFQIAKISKLRFVVNLVNALR